MLLIGKDVIVALSAVFLLWVGAIFIVSSRLVSGNWSLFRNWRQQDRETAIKMQLWLAIPILMGGLFWMRSIAIWHYAAVYGIPLLSLIQMLVYLPAILGALALILRWVFDRRYGPDEGDRLWRRMLWAGGALFVIVLALTRLV